MNILITNISAFSYKKELNTYEIRIDGHISDTIEAYHTNESIIRCLGELKQVRETGGINKIIALTSSKVLTQKSENYNQQTAYEFVQNVAKEIWGQDITFVSILTENSDIEKREKATYKIIEEICNEIGSHDIIYIDSAGGPRTTTNIIQLLSKLLKYKGIKTPLTLYANSQNERKFITDTKEFDLMADLADGFNEFMTSGQSTLLNNLMIGNEEVLFTQMISMMCMVSHKINMGQVDELDISLKELKKAIEACKIDEADNIEAAIIKQFIPIIEEKFFGESGTDIDYFKITQWCLDNDLIQQALTLFVEKIPIYLFDKNIIRYRGNYNEAKQKYDLEKKRNPLWLSDWETKSLYVDILNKKPSAKDKSNVAELKYGLQNNLQKTSNAMVTQVLQEINDYFTIGASNASAQRIKRWEIQLQWKNNEKARNGIINNEEFLASLLEEENIDADNPRGETMARKFSFLADMEKTKIFVNKKFYLSTQIIPILYGYLYAKSVRNSVNHASSEENLNYEQKKVLKRYHYQFQDNNLISVKNNLQVAMDAIAKAKEYEEHLSRLTLSTQSQNHNCIHITTEKVTLQEPKVVGKINLDLLNKYKKKK